MWLEVPSERFSVVCDGGRGGTAIRTRRLRSGMVMAPGSSEPGATATEVPLFKSTFKPSHPSGRAGKTTDSAYVGRVPYALAPIPRCADPPVQRPVAAPGAWCGAGWAQESADL